MLDHACRGAVSVTHCLLLAADENADGRQLDNCVADATALKAALLSCGLVDSDEKCQMLPNFTRSQVFDAADSILASHEPRRVFFYAACHGFDEQGLHIIQPSDSRRPEDDFPVDYMLKKLSQHLHRVVRYLSHPVLFVAKPSLDATKT